MRKPKLRELGEAIKAVIKGPATFKFPAELSPVPEGYRGRPTYDPDVCIGCGACSRVCPGGAIKIVDEITEEKAIRKMVVHIDSCIFCEQCHRNCTTKDGICLSTEYELSGYDRSEILETVERDLVLCEACGDIVATVNHIEWLSSRLQHAAFSSPALMLAFVNDINLLGQGSPRKGEGPLTRSDQMRILCPRCRRKVNVI